MSEKSKGDEVLFNDLRDAIREENPQLTEERVQEIAEDLYRVAVREARNSCREYN